MNRRQLVAIIGTTSILATAACKKEQTPSTTTAPNPPSAATAPAPAAPAAARKPAEGKLADFAADPHKHMKAHFVGALKLQDAVLTGNLIEAKSQASWLASHDKAEPPGWAPYLNVFQARARAAADAPSVEVAAVAVAQIAAACGDCHAGNHVQPKIGSTPIVKKAASVKEHMTGQIEALDKLWAGLIVPSDQDWKEGAGLLANVAVTQKALTKEGLDKAEFARLLAETLHKLSASAAKAPKADRPRVYADLLTTCVACHTTVRQPVDVAAAGAAIVDTK